MPYYRYIKGPVTFLKTDHNPSSKPHQLIAPVLITLGSLLLANVAWPIVYYQIITAPSIRKTEFISPVPMAELSYNSLSNDQADNLPNNTPQVLGSGLDYTDPKTWFPAATYGPNNPTQTSYYLSIPGLDIENAKVIVNGADLDKSIIHYQGTALPGELGSPVLFGHSVLRQFYNPSEDNPNRYISIFSKIMTLKPNDKIYIDYDGVKYTYEVKDKFEVKPEDIFILEQKYNNKELKLITCVPEGTYLRRGVILAQLVNLE
jgi:sortase A